MIHQSPACVGNYVYLIFKKYLQENQYYTRIYSYVEYVCKISNEMMFSDF